MQIWLPFELDLIEKRFLVSESNTSSIDELNKKLKVLVPEHANVSL